MDIVIILLALGMLMFAAYRGFSVILFAPICALFAVLLTDPSFVLPFFSNIFMEKMVGFIKLYFPVFLLGAVFGKVVEISGLAESIAKTIVKLVGAKRAILAIVLMGAILTYSGVSLFVAVFAIYPFAKNLFIKADIPKRLIPGTIALGAFTFTMDALPGTPQIQNVIPTAFFKTNIYAAPWLGLIGAAFVLTAGMIYLESRRKKAANAGEGYAGFQSEVSAAEESSGLANEKHTPVLPREAEPSPARQVLAFVPLILVGVMNKCFTMWLPHWYPDGFDFAPLGLEAFGKIDLSSVTAIWSVELALFIG
ncbi:GntP family permease, partial [Bacillus velezensis]